MLTLLKQKRSFLNLCLLNIFFYLGDGKSAAKYAVDLSTNVLQYNGDMTKLSNTEPGFDLNEEEMTKFHIWRWGVIPYFIDDFSYDKSLRDRIWYFLEQTNGLTGLRFFEIPKPPENDKERWVFFVNRQGLLGCAEHSFANFTNEGVQRVVLGYNCLSYGNELSGIVLSLVGVPPQHNSPDRDVYITVKKENILPGKEYLFKKLENNEWLFHDVPYDFQSAGHYNLHKYTATGSATIAIKASTTYVSIGEGNGFSYLDIWKIKMLYNYISRRKLNTKRISGCIKLFSREKDKNVNEPKSSDEFQPRKKPNKYLGLLHETSDIQTNKTKLSALFHGKRFKDKCDCDTSDENENNDSKSNKSDSSESNESSNASNNGGSHTSDSGTVTNESADGNDSKSNEKKDSVNSKENQSNSQIDNDTKKKCDCQNSKENKSDSQSDNNSKTKYDSKNSKENQSESQSDSDTKKNRDSQNSKENQSDSKENQSDSKENQSDSQSDNDSKSKFDSKNSKENQSESQSNSDTKKNRDSKNSKENQSDSQSDNDLKCQSDDKDQSGNENESNKDKKNDKEIENSNANRNKTINNDSTKKI